MAIAVVFTPLDKFKYVLRAKNGDKLFITASTLNVYP